MAPGIPSVQVFLGQEAVIDGAVTWVDITSYVRLEAGITTSRGQSYGGGAQPGTASLTLDNTDGRFTVGNASSPLYPYVRLQAPVKLLRDGQPWFIGRIQSMPMQWPTGGDSIATTTWALADRLARYERMMLRSYPQEEISATANVCAYWPMTDPSTSTSALALVAVAQPNGGVPTSLATFVSGDATVAFGGGSGPVGDGGPAAQFTPNTGGGWLTGPLTLLTVGDFAVSSSFLTTAGGTISMIGAVSRTAPGITGYLTVSAETYSGQPGIMLRIFHSDTPAQDGWFFYPRAVLDGKTHVVTAVWSSSPPPVYVDGVALTATASSLPPASTYEGDAWIAIGGGPDTRLGATAPFAGSIGHVVLWATTAGSPVGAPQLAALDTLFGITVSTQAAINKALGWRGQAATALIDAGVTDSIPSKALGKTSLASVLAAINASEAGILFVDEQDRLTWKNRRTLPSPVITLSADDIDPGVTYNCDLTRIATLVTCSGGASAAIVQAADYATVGEIAGSVSSITSDPTDAVNHASWVANTGPRNPYIGSLVIDMAGASSAAYTAARTGGILTQVTLTGMPAQTPPNSTVLEVIGEAETISATSWALTWTVLPAGLGSARDVLVLDDATYGVLDSTHRLAY